MKLLSQRQAIIDTYGYDITDNSANGGFKQLTDEDMQAIAEENVTEAEFMSFADWIFSNYADTGLIDDAQLGKYYKFVAK